EPVEARDFLLGREPTLAGLASNLDRQCVCHFSLLAVWLPLTVPQSCLNMVSALGGKTHRAQELFGVSQPRPRAKAFPPSCSSLPRAPTSRLSGRPRRGFFLAGCQGERRVSARELTAHALKARPSNRCKPDRRSRGPLVRRW